MLAYNPFSDLGTLIPSFAMQAFLIAMVLLVIGGVVLDMMHKKNVKYFFENAQKAKQSATKNLSSGEKIKTKTIVVATGARWRELGVPGEKENLGNGVAYCPHCDGPFFKGKDVAVVGGGNSGIEAALDLSGIVNKVSVLEFMPNLKADNILVEKAVSKDNISIFKNAQVKLITSENGKVNGVPMYYISKCLKERGFEFFGKIAAVLFAVFCIGGSFGGGNAAQSNQATIVSVSYTHLTLPTNREV